MLTSKNGRDGPQYHFNQLKQSNPTLLQKNMTSQPSH